MASGSAQQFRYACSALVGMNKKGILKPDDKGYYSMTVGGFNIHNANGVYYALGKARDLIENQSSSFMRRVLGGNCRGELGHPKRGSMTPAEFFARLNEIEEKSVCVHFRNFTLDHTSYKSETGFPQVGVVAELKPAGPYANVLEASIKNPDEETCFSIRSACEEVEEGGKIVRYTNDIVTFDHVNEGGIGIARKYFSIGLEDVSGDLIVTPAIFDIALDKAKLHAGLESADVHRLLSVQETLGWTRPHGNLISVPASMSWR